jgi:hypothetical protein
MSTLAAIIRDSPLLAGLIFILIVVFVFLMIAITSARRAARPPRPRESRRSQERRDRDRYDLEDLGRDYGPAVRIDADLDRDYGRGRGRDDIDLDEPRRRYGLAALVVTFLIGAAAGAAVLHYRSQLPVRTAVNTVVGLVEATSSTAREQDARDETPAKRKRVKAPTPAPRPVQEARAKDEAPTADSASLPPDPIAPAADPLPDDELPDAEVPPATGKPGAPSTADIDDRLVKLVTKLGAELPKEVGPEIQLTTIRTSDRIVTLGYTIDRTANDDDAKEFQKSLAKMVRGIICDGKATEVRYLNDNGIQFYLIFVDQVGKTVGKFAAIPKFCSRSEAAAKP